MKNSVTISALRNQFESLHTKFGTGDSVFERRSTTLEEGAENTQGREMSEETLLMSYNND